MNRNRKGYKYLFIATAILVIAFLSGCVSNGGGTQAQTFRDSDDIQNYIGIVNIMLHPNIDRFVRNVIMERMSTGNTDDDNYAQALEYYRRGGQGSGYVYVDQRGNNYIITNYHVITGAYRLSITFEDEAGRRTRFNNLTVVNADPEADLAILAFPEGQRPFSRGIPLSTETLRYDTPVRAAGYPSMQGIPTWNFSAGNIINPRVQLPGRADRFIQHSAPINHGNSGGPLLVADSRSPLGFSVAGINTFYLSNMHSAFFSITNERIAQFLTETFSHVNEMTALQRRVDDFMHLLFISGTGGPGGQGRIVYEELSFYLSSSMIARDPAGAVESVRNVQPLMEAIQVDANTGIGWAVAYSQIENYIWRKNRNVQPELLSIEENNFGGYTVRFLISDFPYRTEWVREQGTWKLDDFFEDDGEYNDFPMLATPHPMGKRVIYSLASRVDHDWYVLEIPRAGRLRIWTEGNTDTLMRVFTDPFVQDLSRTLIGQHDDISSTNFNSMVMADVQAGTIYVQIVWGGGGELPGDYALIAQIE